MENKRKMKLTKKLSKLNKDGTVAVTLPIRLSRSLGWTSEDFVNITRSGDTLHITKVLME